MSQHQGRSKNALLKSHEAAFNAWVEELRADQAQFMSEKVMHLGLASGAKNVEPIYFDLMLSTISKSNVLNNSFQRKKTL